VNPKSNNTFKFDPEHQPSEEFKQQLKNRVLASYMPSERFSYMRKVNSIVPKVFASMAIISGLVLLTRTDTKTVMNPSQSTNQESNLIEVKIKPSYSTASGGSASGSSVAGQAGALPSYTSLDAAAKAVGFKPFYLTKALGAEQLTELYSAEGLSGGSEKTLYMSFGTSQNLQYQILQTQVAQDNSSLIPPEVERVGVTLDGQTLQATRNEFWNENTPKQDIYPGTPRQTIGFTYKGIAIELTEYGDISTEQLIQIASNLGQ
jgi:hypothetical protein